MGNKNATQISPQLPTSFTHIWLGTNPLIIERSGSESSNGFLRHNENEHMFDDDFECESCIRSVSLETMLILSVNEQMANDIVPYIHDLSQIKAIFICQETNITECQTFWNTSYSKVRIVQPSQLISRMKAFEERWLSRQLDIPSFEVFDTKQGMPGFTSAEINGTFLFSQLLIDMLTQMRPKVTDKDELIECCIKAQKEHPQDIKLEHIQEFRDWYKAEDALKYYTKATFLYKILNKSLRTQNIDFLFLYRFFIRDLQIALAKNQYQTRITVYRGQLMTRQEREQLEGSTGHLISVNSFFSTTRRRDLAEDIYLGGAKVKHELYDYVLFEIDADPAMVRHGQRSFADVSSFSEFPEEQEVLFMLGSIFQITEVCCKDLLSFSENDNIIWIFRMSLCPEDQHELQAVFQNLKNQYGEGENNEIEVTMNSFAIVIFEMHKFELADKFFRRFLRELPHNDQINRARCYHNIGNVALQQGHLRQSLTCFQQALDLYEENHPRRATTCLCLGNLFSRKKNYRKALQYYHQALSLYEQHYGPEHPRVGMCYGNIGSTLIRQRRWIEARDNVEKCLSIQKNCFSQIGDHPDMAFTYASLGLIYEAVNDYDQAIKHEQRALQIRLKLLPHDHQLIMHAYFNLADSHYKKGDLIESNGYFQQYEAIRRQNNIKMNQILYRCPKCSEYVWVYPIFRFCEGLTCFRCRRERFSTVWTNFRHTLFSSR